MDLQATTNFLDALLIIVVPIVLGIFLTRKFNTGWRLWGIGAVIFIASQILHLPFNSFILNPILGTIQQTIPGAQGALMIALTLGLSAGVFEEGARYVMFRWWLKDNRSWRSAILAGAGHGGAEAILIGGLLLWTFINLLALRSADLSKLNLTPDELGIATQQVKAYWSVPWYATLLPLVERIFTIPFHIMASVLVAQVFIRRPGQQQLGWLGLAIFFHTMMDASAVFLANMWSVYAIEAFLGCLALMDIIIIFALRTPESELQPPSLTQGPGQPPPFTPKPVEETSENLEKTRFQ